MTDVDSVPPPYNSPSRNYIDETVVTANEDHTSDDDFQQYPNSKSVDSDQEVTVTLSTINYKRCLAVSESILSSNKILSAKSNF